MEPACVCSPRENYLKKIRGFYHDDGMIKVITGVRRGGKSRLMQCIAEELRAEGVDDEHIVFFGLDRYGYRSVKTPGQLEALVGPLLAVSGTKYLFIDEVQNVGGFEDVLNGLRTEGGFSIFIIGSNSYLLSGELATKLTGRCIEFEMQTLDFGECCQMKRFLGLPVNSNPVAEFDAYILEGGFPKAMDYPRLADKRAYVAAVIQEIFETNIQSDLESRQGVKVKRGTLARYLQILEDAKIVSRCARFDLRSRKSLRGEQKYYLADLGFHFALNTDNRIDYGPVLENIVHRYALAQGCKVSVGRVGKLECDFILRNPEMVYAYVQVAMTIMADRATEEREYRPFTQIKDDYPKYLLTRSDPIQQRDGIIHANIPEFMQEGRAF